MTIWPAKWWDAARSWRRKMKRDRVFAGGMVTIPGVRIINGKTSEPRTSEQVEASLSPAARAEFARFRAEGEPTQ